MNSGQILLGLAAAIFGMLAPPFMTCAGADGGAYRVEKVTLSQAVRLTLEQSHYLRIGESSLRGLEHDVQSAGSAILPRIWFEEKFVRTDMPSYVFSHTIDQERMTDADMAGAPATFNDPGPLSSFTTSLSFEQPIYNPRSGIRVDMAKKEVEASRLSLNQTREDAVFGTLAAFVEVQKAKALRDALEAGVREAAEHHRIAKVREESGMGLLADVLRAGVALADMEGKSVQAHNAILIAQSRLALAMGGEFGEEVDAAGEVTLPVPASLGEATMTALASRNDVRELAAHAENAANLGRLARADYHPTLSVSGAWELGDRDIPFGSDGSHWMIGATLRWEVFDGFRRQAESAKAYEAKVRLRERLEAHKKEVAFRVKEAWLRMDDAAERVKIAKKAVGEASEGSRLMVKRFENSLATMAEVLDAQAALDDARAGLVQAEKDRVLAVARLWHNAGLLMAQVDGLEKVEQREAHEK